MKAKDLKFKIGEWVEFLEAEKLYQKRPGKAKTYDIIIKTNGTKPQVGVIVGAMFKVTGEHVPGYQVMYDDYEQGYIANPKKVLVYLIRKGMLNAPVFALPENVKKVSDEALHWLKFPLQFQNQPEWDEEDRQALREYVKNQPRDEKGRWISQVKQ